VIVETETTETKQAETTAKAAEEKLLPQSQVNDIVAREVKRAEAKVSAQLEEFRAKAAKVEEFEKAAREAEEAKLSATEREKRERAREIEARDKQIAALDAAVKTERQRRHALMIENAAAQRVSGVATKLFNPQLAGVVTREVASLLRVEDDGQGNERVVAVMGAEGDREPLETAWSKIEAERLAPFFKAAGGAGAAHGGGAGAGTASWKDLPASAKIAAGLQARR